MMKRKKPQKVKNPSISIAKNEDKDKLLQTLPVESVLVQIDNETAQFLKMIKESLSKEIRNTVQEIIAINQSSKPSKNGSSDNEVINSLIKRVDSIEGKVDEINDSISVINSALQKMNVSITRIEKSLSSKGK